MTKKDYKIIADVLRITVRIWNDAKKEWEESKKKDRDKNINEINIILSVLDVLTQGFIFELKRDNPRFDAEKFKEAIGKIK